jgi:hypothetical protein
MKASLSFGVFALFAGIWPCMVWLGVARQFKKGERLNWLVAIAGIVLAIGVVDFFGTALTATGVVPLPDSFEWPPGYVRGVVETWDGKYVVPLVYESRLQIYDSQWHFIRGWHVANGHDFTVTCSPNNEIEVFASRGRHYSFTENGKLISVTTTNDPFVSAPGELMAIPTSRLLLIFSNPFLSGGLMILGSAGLWAVNKVRGYKWRSSSNQSV